MSGRIFRQLTLEAPGDDSEYGTIPQAQVLASLGPDLISIAAMPGAVEAHGAARFVPAPCPQLSRIQGLKANGSSLTPAELLALNRAVADDPEDFAEELLLLGLSRDFRVYGGCCGTDTAHLESLARRVAALL